MKEYRAAIYLSDGNMKSSAYEFKIKINNTAPIFKGEIKAVNKVQLRKEIIVPLPEIFDKENNPVFVKFTKIPSFARYDKGQNSL